MQKHNETQKYFEVLLATGIPINHKILQTQPDFAWLINNRGVKEKFKAVSEKLIELSELVFIRGKAQTSFMCEASLKSLSEVAVAGD